MGLLTAAGFAARGAFWRGAEANDRPTSERAGDMLMVNAYVEEPAGDWAAAGADLRLHAWLFNDGEQADVLRSVSSPVAGSVRVDGAQLPVEIAAQDWKSFGPGGDYFVLEDLTRPVQAGRTVSVTFDFAEAGELSAHIVVLQRESAATPSPTVAAPGEEDEAG
jgi:copper(I)-binding protein